MQKGSGCPTFGGWGETAHSSAFPNKMARCLKPWYVSLHPKFCPPAQQKGCICPVRRMHSQVGLRLSQIQSHKEVRHRPQRSADGRLQDVTCYFPSQVAAPSSQQGYSQPKDHIHRKRTDYYKIYMEIQKTPNSKMILRKKKKAGDMVLAQKKQTYGSMEQIREPRNKSMFIWSINLQQRK